MKIRPEETLIHGSWEARDNEVHADAVCTRIDELVDRHLHEVARDESGWDVLYIDPDDKRYWELTYPNSGSHGGGPPRLENVSPEYVAQKYYIDNQRA